MRSRQPAHPPRLAVTDPFYLSKAWRAVRAAHLARHPRCSVPGCQVPANNVDHHQARNRGGAALDPANLRSMCQSHHSQKTARLDHQHRRSTTTPLQAKGCDSDGWPLAEAHPWRT